MKKILLIFIIAGSFGVSQGNIYPRETNYGGGVGFSTMYMVLDSIPGQSILNDLGFDIDELGTKPLVFYGGEGFAQMSGPWRLGGYAGIGSTRRSKVYDIKTYEEKNNNPGYQKDDVDETNTLQLASSSFTAKARISFLIGAMTFEYVIPIYRDLEVTAGALMGMGAYSLGINQTVIDIEKYSDIGKHLPNNELGNNPYYAYYDGDDETVYVDLNEDKKSAKDLKNAFLEHKYETTDVAYREVNLTGSMTELSGSFFNFQPYIAVKWQFLDRTGLRISAGFNKSLIKSDNLKVNGYQDFGDATNSSLHGFTVRTVLYFGL
jgi:hypothetical protein